MVQKRIIKTRNKEIYDKLNMLNYNPDVVIRNFNIAHLTKIINNINKHNKVLSAEQVGDYVIITKHCPINFLVYYVG